MRLVLDLQATQTEGSGHRGVGRYSEGLAIHLARQRGDDDLRVCLNSAYSQSVRRISASLQPTLGRERISFCLDAGFADAALPGNAQAPLREALIRRHWAALQPDVLHVSHVFEPFVVPQAWPRIPGLVRSSTLYDLIPLRFPEHYLVEPAFKAWYFSKLEILRECDLLLAISETSRLDAIELLGLPGDRITTIWGGVDEKRFRPRTLGEDELMAFRARHGLGVRFVIHTGGDDYRKNLEGAIAGFAEVPRPLRQGVQLAIVCRLSDERRTALTRVAEMNGLAAGDVVMTGFVSDDDLARFYSACEAFVFPSLYEGLGLPVLEAMSSGAAVLGGRNSSIRELIGDEDAMFDARDPASMAQQLVRVLSDAEFRRRLRENSLVRARLFTWERSARLALEGLRAAHAAAALSQASISPGAIRRKRVAWFTPLPPCRSGIADYLAAFLPYLARHFSIDVFIEGDASTEAVLREDIAVFSHHEFEQRSTHYEAVVYEMGNSEFHAYMLPYLAHHPGVVVLHDAFLGGLYGYVDFQCGDHGRYVAEMLGSHGPRARRCLAPIQGNPDPIGRSMAELPATRSVIDQAIGLISYSPASLGIANEAYPEGFAGPYRAIKQMVEIPRPTDGASRSAARTALGFGATDIVVSTFGHITWTKCGDRLVDAFLDPMLYTKQNANLVFVGEPAQDEFGRMLRERIANSGLGTRARITGYVDKPTYELYLAATDVAVQLRTRDRGETSKAVLDCFAAAVPVIVNDTGTRDYPAQAVGRIGSDCDPVQLAQVLTALLADSGALTRMGAAGREHVSKEHGADRIAGQFALAVDEMVRRHTAASLHDGVREAGGLLATQPTSDAVLAASARALQASQPAMLFRTRRLLIDVSIVAERDHGTGVQRVVNAIVRQLYVSNRAGFTPLAVRLERGRLVDASDWLATQGLLTEIEKTRPLPALVAIERGDCLLMLDSSWDRFDAFSNVFAEIRAANGLVYTTIYDLLPVRMPKSFLPGMVETFRRWLEQAIVQSDGLVCISRAVADDVCDFIQASPNTPVRTTIDIGYWHLGADFIAESRLELTPSATTEMALTGRTLLMVGTMEPRKNHALALDAMEILWRRGADVNLCVAGRAGWSTDKLTRRIKRHPELGRRLRWLSSPGDEDLQYAYRHSAGLLFLSAAEGFGLPLVEAARFGVPILSADIPVAREVCGPHATYVPLRDADAMADAIEAWLAAGGAPDSRAMPVLTWEESADALLGVVLDQRWYRSFGPVGHAAATRA